MRRRRRAHSHRPDDPCCRRIDRRCVGPGAGSPRSSACASSGSSVASSSSRPSSRATSTTASRKPVDRSVVRCLGRRGRLASASESVAPPPFAAVAALRLPHEVAIEMFGCRLRERHPVRGAGCRGRSGTGAVLPHKHCVAHAAPSASGARLRSAVRATPDGYRRRVRRRCHPGPSTMAPSFCRCIARSAPQRLAFLSQPLVIGGRAGIETFEQFAAMQRHRILQGCACAGC